MSQSTPRDLPVGRSAPAPPAEWLFGHARHLSRDPLGTLLRWRESYGDVLRLRFGSSVAHVVTHPHDVRRVLQENHQNYNKKTRGYQKLSLFMGNGLLTSNGDFWRRQRKLAQPAFHRQRIEGFARAVQQATQQRLDHWQQRIGTPFDVASEMMSLTLRIVGETLFGVDLSSEADRVQRAIVFIQRDAERRINGIFDIPLSIPTPNNLRLRRARATLDEILWRVIRERRRQLSVNRDEVDVDLLGMLIEARDEDTGDTMSDEQLRDELMTMFLAGHESTANALTWTWHLLGKHPEVTKKLQQELDDSLAGRTPQLADLSQLPYCLAVVKEALRLYPPGWSFGRAPIEDDTVGGYQLPAGSLVILCPWVTHRHPDFWPHPNAFTPERFLSDEVEHVRYQYFPFGAGPRVCIGNAFAMMEAQLIVAMVAQRYAITPVADQRVIPEANITLRPRDGLQVVITERTPCVA